MSAKNGQPRRIPSIGKGPSQPSAYDRFDEQAWLTSLTAGIQNALYGPISGEITEQHDASSVSRLQDLEQWASSLRAQRQRSQGSKFVDEEVQTDNPFGKEGSGYLAARELLALGGFAHDEPDGVLELQELLSGAKGDISDGTPVLRRASHTGLANASELFGKSLEIDQILRQRMSNQLLQGDSGGECDEDHRDGDGEDDHADEQDLVEAMQSSQQHLLIQDMGSPIEAAKDVENDDDEDDEDDDDADDEDDDDADDEDDDDAEDGEEDKDYGEGDEDQDDGQSQGIKFISQQHTSAQQPLARNEDEVIEISSSSEEGEEDEDELDGGDDEGGDDNGLDHRRIEAAIERAYSRLDSGDGGSFEEDQGTEWNAEAAQILDSNQAKPSVVATIPYAKGDDEGADDDDKIEQVEWQGCYRKFEEDSHLDIEVCESSGYIAVEGEGDSNAEDRYADKDPSRGEDDDDDDDDEVRPAGDKVAERNQADPPPTKPIEMPQFPVAAPSPPQESAIIDPAIAVDPPPSQPPTAFLLDATVAIRAPTGHVTHQPESSAASIVQSFKHGSLRAPIESESAPAGMDTQPQISDQLVDFVSEVQEQTQTQSSGPPSVVSTEGTESRRSLKAQEFDREILQRPSGAALNSIESSTAAPTTPLPLSIPTPLVTPTAERLNSAQPTDEGSLSVLKHYSRPLIYQDKVAAGAGATVAPDGLAQHRAKYRVAPIEATIEPIAGCLDPGPENSIFAPPSNKDPSMTLEDAARVIASAAWKAQSERSAHEQTGPHGPVAEADAQREPAEVAATASPDVVTAPVEVVESAVSAQGDLHEPSNTNDSAAVARTIGGDVNVDTEVHGPVLEEPTDTRRRAQEISKGSNQEGGRDDESMHGSLATQLELNDPAESLIPAKPTAESLVHDEPADRQELNLDRQSTKQAALLSQTQGAVIAAPESFVAPSAGVEVVPSISRVMYSVQYEMSKTLDAVTESSELGTSPLQLQPGTSREVATPAETYTEPSEMPQSLRARSKRFRDLHEPAQSAVPLRTRFRHLHGPAGPDDAEDEPEDDQDDVPDPPQTRSHCGFSKLRVTAPAALASEIVFVVPQCSVRHDLLESEKATVLGRATKADNEDKVEFDANDLEEDAYHRLARLIGHEMMAEAWLLPTSGEVDAVESILKANLDQPTLIAMDKGRESSKDEMDLLSNDNSFKRTPGKKRTTTPRRHRKLADRDRDWLPPASDADENGEDDDEKGCGSQRTKRRSRSALVSVTASRQKRQRTESNENGHSEDGEYPDFDSDLFLEVVESQTAGLLSRRTSQRRHSMRLSSAGGAEKLEGSPPQGIRSSRRRSVPPRRDASVGKWDGGAEELMDTGEVKRMDDDGAKSREGRKSRRLAAATVAAAAGSPKRDDISQGSSAKKKRGSRAKSCGAD